MKPSISTAEEMRRMTIERFWETFPVVWNQVTGNVRWMAADQFGITVEQFHVLRHIRRGTGSVSELATVKQISRSAISQTVEVLVEKGLITRTQSAGDRRFVRLELTQRGDDLLNTLFEKNRGWMMEKLSALSPEEIETIFCALEALKRAFDAPIQE